MLAQRNEQVAVAGLHDAAAIVIARGRRPVLPEDDPEIVKPAAGVVQFRPRHGGTAAAAGPFGEAEIDRPVLGIGPVDNHVEQSALAGRPDLGHPLERRGEHAIAADHAHTARVARSPACGRQAGMPATTDEPARWRRSGPQAVPPKRRTSYSRRAFPSRSQRTRSRRSPPSARRRRGSQVFSSQCRLSEVREPSPRDLSHELRKGTGTGNLCFWCRFRFGGPLANSRRVVQARQIGGTSAGFPKFVNPRRETSHELRKGTGTGNLCFWCRFQFGGPLANSRRVVQARQIGGTSAGFPKFVNPRRETSPTNFGKEPALATHVSGAAFDLAGL